MTDPQNFPDQIDLNGRMISFMDILRMSPDIEGRSEFETDVLSFVQQWLSDQRVFHIKTSGTTGVQKNIILKREQMETSAKATIKLFKLNPGKTILLCLPAKYIAGKMMIVRSLVGNLKLLAREPKGNPIDCLTGNIDFTAMVPLQLSNLLESNKGLDRINLLKSILVGGGSINRGLEKKCSDLQPAIFHSYGMTETSTHIAVRRINGPNRTNLYKILPGIKISTDSKSCLIIQGKVTEGEKLITNDVVELHGKTEFKWIGRNDQVINTGGIKIIPEELEDKISIRLLDAGFDNNFFITGIADERLGHKIIMIFESKATFINTNEIIGLLGNSITKFELPKEIYTIYPFVYTDSGKIDRNGTLKIINFKDSI